MATLPDAPPARPPHLLVIGSSNTDFVVRCKRLPKPGETLRGGVFAEYPGGKGANQAVAAARAGASVAFIGLHGADAHGTAAKQRLADEGINVHDFRETIDGVPSGVALILLAQDSAENMIVVAESANDKLHPEHLQQCRGAFDNSDVILTQLEVPMETVEMAGVLCEEYDTPLVLNPAPAAELSERLLKRLHAITPNESELKLLTGKRKVEDGARALREAGCKHVVVTLGSRGAYYDGEDGEPRSFSAVEVQAVDTVGAGDCFAAWFATGLAEKRPVTESIERAIRAAAIATTRAGAQPSMPRRAEVEDA